MGKLININNYSNIIFDCDGVILDSNKIKEANIEKAANKYMPKDRLIPFLQYFNSNTGIPRELKICEFLKEKKSIKYILDDYHNLNLLSLKKSMVVPGFIPFIKNVHKTHKNKFVISGGDQSELLEILLFKNLTKYFDKILGGPKSKEENVESLQLAGNTIYFGDSEIDYQMCKQYNFDFVFVSGYSNYNFRLDPEYKIEIHQIENFNEIIYEKKN